MEARSSSGSPDRRPQRLTTSSWIPITWGPLASRAALAGRRQQRRNVTGQQFIAAVDRMVGDARAQSADTSQDRCRFAPGSGTRRRHRRAARQRARAPDVCNIARNAGLVDTSTPLVRVTHPFHRFIGRQLICVGERYNRPGKRLLLRIDDKSFCSAPPRWIDMSEPDPEVPMGKERALFTVADLMELACLRDTSLLAHAS